MNYDLRKLTNTSNSSRVRCKTFWALTFVTSYRVDTFTIDAVCNIVTFVDVGAICSLFIFLISEEEKYKLYLSYKTKSFQ